MRKEIRMIICMLIGMWLGQVIWDAGASMFCDCNTYDIVMCEQSR